MEGLQRWSIRSGPDEVKPDGEVRFEIESDIPGVLPMESQAEISLKVQVWPIAGGGSQLSFLGGRLFTSGDVIIVWGVYDPRVKTGELWIWSVPRPYTGYYGVEAAKHLREPNQV